ncbi:SURF1 family cytochrome oxidase biogenesis protein [Sphingomonas tabacisoli]|uniref:SURF1-like protein n=1 Tax=Sphingomonas tabacisoli TaxID=2249466 RepID=A0ABW4HXZ4_9SPHN
MKRLPILPTVIVAAAVAAMIGLGIWQLQRLHWKVALLARYAAAQGQPPIAFPTTPDPRNPPLFRRASAMCEHVIGWRSQTGYNLKEEVGYAHIASCRSGAEGPGFQAVIGWSATPTHPAWAGGMVSGVIAPDRDHVVKLVAASAAPGLQPVKPPSLENVPNNHLAYAIQWFFFAATAAVIYLLALRRRSR